MEDEDYEKLKCVGIPVGAGPSGSMLRFKYKCENCGFANRNRGMFASIEAIRDESGRILPDRRPDKSGSLGKCAFSTTGTSVISVLEEHVGMKPQGSTYDKKAVRNGVGKPMMCVCFYCAGELVQGDPGYYVLPGFLPLDTREAIKKFNTRSRKNLRS